MTTPIKYDVTVMADQAHRESKKLEDDFRRIDGAATAAGKSIDSAAKPTRNTGMAFLDLSRAVEDAQYGLRGIQNNIPGIVMSLGGSAGLTGAISLAVIATTQLYEKFTAIPEAVKDAKEKAAKELDEMKDDIRDVADELESIATGLEVESIRRQRKADELLGAAGEEAQGFIDRYGALTPDSMRKIADLARAGLTVELEVYDQKTQSLKTVKQAASEVIDAYRGVALASEQAAQAQQLAVDVAAAKGLRKLAREEANDAKDAESASRKRQTKEKSDAIKIARENAAELARAEADAEAEVRRQIALRDREDAADGGSLKKSKERAKMIADREELVRRNTLKAFDKFNNEELKLQEAHAKAMAGVTVDAVGAIATAIVGAASGQKDAWADLLTYGAKAAGDLITLEGSKSLGTGIAAVAMGNPAGVGQIATGLGIIAAGQAISIGGAAAVGALTGAAGKGSAASGGRDPGASPRRASGGTGGDGSLVVNVSYGVAGPLPEDTARAIAAAVKTGDRRRGGR